MAPDYSSDDSDAVRRRDDRWLIEHYRELMERHLAQSNFYQALLRCNRAQAKGLKRQAAKIKRLQKLATCECGDGFTKHDPGTCVNCFVAHNAAHEPQTGKQGD